MAVTGSHARRLVAAMPMLACALLFGFLLAIRISAPAMAQSSQATSDRITRAEDQAISAHDALLRLTTQVDNLERRASMSEADTASLHAQLNTASAIGMVVVSIFGVVATIIFKKGS
jgi:hypothetical protein